MKNQKIIEWRRVYTQKGENVTHNITNISIDPIDSTIVIVVESGIKVNRIIMSMEHAKEIGFINLNALSDYCK